MLYRRNILYPSDCTRHYVCAKQLLCACGGAVNHFRLRYLYVLQRLWAKHCTYLLLIYGLLLSMMQYTMEQGEKFTRRWRHGCGRNQSNVIGNPSGLSQGNTLHLYCMLATWNRERVSPSDADIAWTHAMCGRC